MGLLTQIMVAQIEVGRVELAEQRLQVPAEGLVCDLLVPCLSHRPLLWQWRLCRGGRLGRGDLAGAELVARMTIDLRRIEDTPGHQLIAIIGQQAPIVAATIALMAGSPALLNHADQQAIFLTVDKDGAYLLSMPGLLALAPDGLARAAVEVSIAGFSREAQGLLIHKGDHQHL